jgi:alpha-L-fucosidase
VVPRRTADTEKIASASQQAEDERFRLRPIRATDQDLGSRTLLAEEPELIWYPAEVDTSIRPGWFWHAAEDDRVRPLEKLIDIYEKSVGGNAMLLLNIPPTTEGLFHKNDVERLRQLGAYIRSSYGSDLLAQAALSASPAAEGCPVENVRTDDESFYLPAEETGTAELTAVWPQEQCIRRVVLQEQLRLSQRVERFTVDALINGVWQPVAEGTVIGHKRIVVLDGVRTAALRVRITDARVAPTLRRVGVYG